MNRLRVIAVVALMSLVYAGVPAGATAQEGTFGPRAEVSLLGGLQILNENDTAFQDHFVNGSAVAALGYHVTEIFLVEGEFTWMIPVEQSVDTGSSVSQDRSTPDILAYQANVRALLPVSISWSPYLAAGAGAITILSDTGADLQPQVDETQTMFAVNFGAGINYDVSPRWLVRADFREFIAFPSDDAAGLSDASGADEIWMERGTLGLGYRF